MAARRILILEDETPVAELMAEFLRRAGHEVVASVATGEAALAMAARHQPDLASPGNSRCSASCATPAQSPWISSMPMVVQWQA